MARWCVSQGSSRVRKQFPTSPIPVAGLAQPPVWAFKHLRLTGTDAWATGKEDGEAFALRVRCEARKGRLKSASQRLPQIAATPLRTKIWPTKGKSLTPL